MSSTVDSRVVQIKFDNKEFERNVQQTIDSLERLNSAIEGKGTPTISDAFNNANFGAIASGVDSIKDRFSVLGIVGITVLQRITNAGIDMALKIGGSIKKIGDQISQGGFIRAQNLEQAKFLLKGLGADVTAVLEDVDQALTGTAYGLDEGAKTAAIFFTSGIKQGKEMYTALRAVAGAAAMTGSSYQGIADVFQDAAAKGAVMTMEIQRLQMQGVKADKYLLDFINDVVDGGDKVEDVSDSVKKSVMDLTNGTKLSMEDLTEDRKGLLSKGAISFEVFAAAMDAAFGEHAQKANETFAGSLANLKTALSRLGEAFISPAMQAAIPLFNSLQAGIKDFANTLIKTTSMSDHFTRVVKDIGDGLSGIVDKATEIGIFSTMGQIAYKTFLILVKVLYSVRDAFKEAFPNATLNNLKKGLNSVLDAVDNLYLNLTKSGGFAKLKNSIVEFLDVVKSIAAPFKTVFGIIKDQSGNAFKIISNLAQIIGKILVVAFGALDAVLKSLKSPIDFIMTAFANLSDSLNNAFSKDGSFKSVELLGSAFEKIGSGIHTAAGYIEKAVSKILSYFKFLVSGSKDSIGNFIEFRDVLEVLGAVIGGGALAKGIKLSTPDKITDFFEKLKEAILDVPDKISETFSTLTDAINDMTNKVKADMLKQIALGVLALAISMKILSTLSIEELATSLGAITILLWELSVTMERLFSTVEGFDAKKIKGIAVVTTALMKLGIALLIMAVALKIISTIEYGEMAAGLGAMVIMLGSVMGFVIGIDKLGGRKAGAKVEKVAAGLTSIAIALLILSASVKILSSLGIVELAKGLGGVIVLLGAILGFIVAIDKLSKGGGKGMITAGIGLIAIATALNILTPALQRLGSMDLPSLAKGMISIVAALGAMAAASQFTSAAGAVGIFIMATALGALVGAVEKMGTLPMPVITQGLFSLVGALLMFGLVSVALSGAIAPMLGIAAAMLALSAAIAILGAGLIMIGAGLTAISAGIMSFAAVSQTAVLMFANTVQTLVTALIQMFPQIAVALAESFVSFLESLAELAPRFREAVTTILAELLGAVNDNIDNIIQTGVHIVLALADGLVEAIPALAGKAVTLITSFLEAIGSYSAVLSEAGANLVIDFINGIAQGIEGKGEELRTAIWNLCTTILEEFKGFFGINSPSTVMEQMGGFLMQGLLNGIRGVGGIGSAILGAVKTGLSKVKSMGGQFKQRGMDLIKNVGAGIKGKAGDVKTKIGDAIRKAKEKVGEYKGQFKTAGSDLAKGIGSGINAATSWVKTQVGNLADALKRKVKEKLDINSPSKVFAKIAEGIPEGMAVGVKRAGHYAINAVGTLAEATIDPVAQAISKVEELMDIDSDFSPTITPILDLSEVEKSAGGIQSIFGNNSISLASSIGQNAQNMNNNMLMTQLIDKLSNLSSTGETNTFNNTFNLSGVDNPESFVNDFIRTLDREMKMRTA